MIFQARALEWVAIAFSDILSRLVITFLPRSKRLLISQLQSPSAYSTVVLEIFYCGGFRGDGWAEIGLAV